MKQYFIFILLSIMSLVSCTNNTGIIVTKPGSDLILDKMNSGTWAGAKAEGNNLNISVSTDYQGNYTFDSPVLGIGGIYKNDKGGYILTAPIGSDLAVVGLTQEAKEAVDAVLDVLDDAGGESVIGNLVNVVVKEGADKIDLSNPDKILAGTSITMEKYEEVRSILEKSKGGFKTGEIIN